MAPSGANRKSSLPVHAVVVPAKSAPAAIVVGHVVPRPFSDAHVPRVRSADSLGGKSTVPLAWRPAVLCRLARRTLPALDGSQIVVCGASVGLGRASATFTARVLDGRWAGVSQKLGRSAVETAFCDELRRSSPATTAVAAPAPVVGHDFVRPIRWRMAGVRATVLFAAATSAVLRGSSLAAATSHARPEQHHPRALRLPQPSTSCLAAARPRTPSRPNLTPPARLVKDSRAKCVSSEVKRRSSAGSGFGCGFNSLAGCS